MNTQPPVCQQVIEFLKTRHGKSCTAPLTGMDWRCLAAFAHLVDAWSCADHENQPHVEKALAAILLAPQTSVIALFKSAIEGITNETDMYVLWPRISPATTRLNERVDRREREQAGKEMASR